ncbi:hypothetical protein DH2020_007510 [Rehmannia glutinosa]|uniref:Uncharacterized protein n=1 Tax=Rehmannia glutinosa TaxID=99300 RepID=A0ABR0TZ68_REHGL
MKTRTGEDSLELYQACILPHDQITLGVMSDTRLEDITTHDLMRAANIVHNLTLRGHHWRVRFMEAEDRATRFEKEKVAIEAKTKSKYEPRIKLVESKLSEFEIRAKNSEASLKVAHYGVDRLTAKVNKALVLDKRSKRKAFNSPEFANQPLGARHKELGTSKIHPFLIGTWYKKVC